MSQIEMEQVLERLGEHYELVAAADRVVDQYTGIETLHPNRIRRHEFVGKAHRAKLDDRAEKWVHRSDRSAGYDV